MLQFLDKAKIKAILINEGITMHRVVFYLAFVVEGRKQMVVAFEHLKPRLHILVKIYRYYVPVRNAVVGACLCGGFRTCIACHTVPGG